MIMPNETWAVSLVGQAKKAPRNLPKDALRSFVLLMEELKSKGPHRYEWPNFSKLGNAVYTAVMLRGLRYREGLTQVELGKLLGIAQGNISLMEKGKRTIGKDIAKRLAHLFKTDYRLFL